MRYNYWDVSVSEEVLYHVIDRYSIIREKLTMDTAFSVTASIIMIVLGIIVVIQMVLISSLLVILRNLAQELRERANPLINRAAELLETANDIGHNVQHRSAQVSGKVADTTDVVGDSIAKTTRVIQHVAASPVIGAAALSEGIAATIAAWRSARKCRKR